MHRRNELLPETQTDSESTKPVLTSNQSPLRRKSLVLHDGPNVTSLLYRTNGGSPYNAVSSWDFRGVRTKLTHRYGKLHCEYVVTARSRRNRRPLGSHLQSCGWKLVEASPQPLINRDPTDAYIVTRIQAARSMLGVGPFERVVVISHDGGFALSLKAFVATGGSATICAFTGVASARLRALGGHPRIDFLDLNRDLHALQH